MRAGGSAILFSVTHGSALSRLGGRAGGGEEYDRVRRVTRQDRLRVSRRLLFGEGGFLAEPAFLAVRGDCVPPKHVPVIPPVRVSYPAHYVS